MCEKPKIVIKLSNITTGTVPFFAQQFNSHNQSNLVERLVFSTWLHCTVTIPEKHKMAS